MSNIDDLRSAIERMQDVCNLVAGEYTYVDNDLKEKDSEIEALEDKIYDLEQEIEELKEELRNAREQ